ncbi:MAG: hypothetical protein AB7L13_06205 [Acidimicrobiia bacterium]
MGDFDDQIRRGVADVEVFDFGEPTVTEAPVLSDARVAIVTTAGLRADGLGVWGDGQGFVAIPSGERNLVVAQASATFDRAGIALDLNVVYPADRLEDMVTDHTIGSVAREHLSFMGAQPDHTLTTLRLDSGPAAAKRLLDDGVTVVLLTPV